MGPESLNFELLEKVMRVTVKLDSFDHAGSSAYAVLWLDRETRRWSREGHDTIELPSWGMLRSAADGTGICGAERDWTILLLKGLTLESAGPLEGAQGKAEYRAEEAAALEVGRWHVQCVDRDAIQAEHEVFADDQDEAWTYLELRR
jgi:hypothetical protein